MQETEDEKELQDEHKSEAHNDESLPPGAWEEHIAIMASSIFQCLKILNSNKRDLYLY